MTSKSDNKTVITVLRIHDLSKELGVSSKILIDKCASLNIKVKSHASILTRGQADRIRSKVEKDATDAVTTEEPAKDTQVTRKKLTRRTTVTRKVTKRIDVSSTAAVETPSAAPDVQGEGSVVEGLLADGSEIGVHGLSEAGVAEAPSAAAESAAQALEPSTDGGGAEQPETAAPEKAPKLITAGADLVPPVKNDLVKNVDGRFGVVISAEEAKKIHGEEEVAEKKKGPKQVESEKVEEFKAKVSYPSVPKTGAPSDDQKMGADERRPGMRRVLMGGGRRGGPRRGVALMNQGERYRKSPHRKKSRGALNPTVVRTGPAEVTSPVTISSLCSALGIKAAALIRKFLEQGRDDVRMNTILPDGDAELYAAEFDPMGFGIKIKKARDVEEELLAAVEKPDNPEDLRSRAPVVTVMGHVDHGKTSLLDRIRTAAVAAGEAGGITQHIAAYAVHTTHGPICFLDTPGHRAFTEMRARGANVTDIVVLVVAWDDGVMPQTEEAINHARAANKTIIVAINKMDLPDANSDKVKGELATKEVYLEGYGGEVQCQEVSAKTGQGIQELLEKIALEAEVLELKANPEKPGIGTVVEAHKDAGRGIVCTLLVQEGTLKQGDVIVCGHSSGTVRQLLNDREKTIHSAGPSEPVLITGLNDVPLAGERFHVVQDIKYATVIAQKRAMAIRQEGLVARQKVTLENFHDLMAHGDIASLKMVLKVDVMGSLNPVENAILELSSGTEDARIEVLHSAVGGINETDILLADASGAIVIGFHVTADPGARRLAEDRGVEIRTYEVIYEVVDEMRKALEGLLKPIEQEEIQGHLEIRRTFKISKMGVVAGCMVLDGLITRNSMVRLIRDAKPVWSGKLSTLKRVKDDAREVREGFECGVKLENYDDLKLGDIIEAYAVTYIARTLNSTTAY